MSHSHNIGNNLMRVLIAQSCPTLFDPMDCSLPGPWSMGFFRQEYWRVACPPPGDLPDPGMEPWSPASRADSLPFELQGNPYNLIDSTYLFKIFAQVCPLIFRLFIIFKLFKIFNPYISITEPHT